jgi:hypothetical protein
MPALGRLKRPVRRRGAPLVSRWLPAALAIGSVDDAADDEGLRAHPRPGALTVLFALAADGAEPAPLLPPRGDDVRFAGLMAEIVRVIADLSEGAGLPTVGIAPDPERRGVELAIGAVGTMSAVQLADAMLLLRVAVESVAHARGLQLVEARVKLDGSSAPLDGRLCRFFSREA